MWIIRDNARQIATGCLEQQRALAEEKLGEYVRGEIERTEKVYFVYFVTAKHDGFPIKIGITTTVAARLSTIQTTLPYDIEVIGIFSVGSPMQERIFHDQFSHLRLRGEWFERSDEIYACVTAFEAERKAA